MGANQRGQGTGRTYRAIVPDVGLLVVMPGFSNTHGQQKQDAQQGGDTGDACMNHKINRSSQWSAKVIQMITRKSTSVLLPKGITQGRRIPGRSGIGWRLQWSLGHSSATFLYGDSACVSVLALWRIMSR